MSDAKELTKGQQTGTKVLDAAFQLFVSQGYHGTSMRQIAQAAGLTPASIYNHFENKEAIFRQVLMQHHPYHEILPILESAEGEDVEAIVRNVATRVYQVIRARKELLNLLFSELVEFEGRHMAEIFNSMSPRIFTFLSKLQAASGQLRPISQSSVLLSLVGTIMAQWLMEASFLKHVHLPGSSNQFETAVDIYLHGILADPQGGTP